MTTRTCVPLALAALALFAAVAPAHAQVRIVSATPDEGSRTVRMRPAGALSDDRTSATGLTFSVGGLSPGARIELGFAGSLTPEQRNQEANAPVATRCRGRIASAPSAEISKIVPANGVVTFRVKAMYEIPNDGSNAAANGPCSLNIAFVVSERGVLIPSRADFLKGGKPEPVFMILRTPSITLRPWTVYRYNDTWALRRFFNFTVRGEGLSTCTGTSIGPTLYPVGAHERGGDLALQIRSGVLGTVCRAGSPGIAVSDNVRLTAIDWAIERDGTKCEAGDAASRKVGENVVIAPGHLPDDTVGAYMGGTQPDIARLLGVTQPTLRQDQHIVGFAHSWLWCDKTLINDHGVRLVLRSATFEGPANADMP